MIYEESIVFTVFMVASLVADAQVDFMGIPVEGSVSAMKSQLRKKGFRRAPSIYDDNDMVGKFFNRDVVISIAKNENNNEIYGIGVFFMSDIKNYEGYDKSGTIRLFNELVFEFEEKDNYENIIYALNKTLPKTHYEMIDYNTNLWYNIKVEGVDYHAYYRQLPTNKFNSVHFSILPDNSNYDKYKILLFYENLKNKTFGDEDL